MSKNLDELYSYLVDEEDARVCTEISDEACREVPGNFFVILLSQLLTKLGDALVNAKTVLPWIMNTVGAPTFLTGLLVPIRESGSLIPQLILGGVIRQYAVRKWFFVLGCVLQGGAVAAMAFVAVSLEGILAGGAVIGLLILFSLARGFCSVASKDVLGKTIPKSRRGTLTGYSASAAGLVSLGAGLALIFGEQANSDSYWLLLIGGGVCWWLAALMFARIQEYRGATEGGGNAVKEALKNLAILKEDRGFRSFVLVRLLMMSSGLCAPYIILLATGSDNSLFSGLGFFIVASGVASLVSGVIWGKLADRSSRKVLVVTSLSTTVICLIAGWLSYMSITTYWYFLVLFFLLSVTHEGVRLGRKTYVVDLAEGNRRTDYVSVSNTFIGVMLLVVGVAGAGLAQISISLVLALFGLASFVAMVLAYLLKEVQEQA